MLSTSPSPDLFSLVVLFLYGYVASTGVLVYNAGNVATSQRCHILAIRPFVPIHLQPYLYPAVHITLPDCGHWSARLVTIIPQKNRHHTNLLSRRQKIIRLCAKNWPNLSDSLPQYCQNPEKCQSRRGGHSEDDNAVVLQKSIETGSESLHHESKLFHGARLPRSGKVAQAPVIGGALDQVGAGVPYRLRGFARHVKAVGDGEVSLEITNGLHT